ncbi:Detected protein of unknown function [Hibiscus syriacus]|uniref:Uncharacterized protein n=1 Tax=Hibiscus syriacus TaxID=106335 RepID=A0A6A3ADZ5_HIBSY|nr:Detected protein of unknown function [Hibiscus syriacus]
MRCKEHLTDLSSSVGVCATCLRQRLLAVLAAQAQLALAAESLRKPDPPPLIFPRSVSPYVSRRKSGDDGANWIHNQRFYHTPQVGPTHGTETSGDFEAVGSFKKKNRFSFFSDLFRLRSEKFNSDPSVHYNWDSSGEPSSSSPSLFSALFAVRRKKNQSSGTTRVEEFGQFGPGNRKPSRVSDRGMSPAIEAASGDECHRLSSRISPEASPRWKRTPKAARRSRSGAGNSSGLAFYLSPLVRANPNPHWNQKGGLPPDVIHRQW